MQSIIRDHQTIAMIEFSLNPHSIDKEGRERERA